MAEQEKPKREYKPRKPDLGRVLEAIVNGEYDDELLKIRKALETRVQHKQDEVMKLVHATFGDEADIILKRTHVEEATDTPPMPGANLERPRPNPFMGKVKPKEAADESNEPLPGPYKVSPGDGNSYRVDTDVEAPPGMVMITDVMGGHQVGITQEEWDSWPDESGQAQAQATEVTESERRGAIIGGLHPSDIGE